MFKKTFAVILFSLTIACCSQTIAQDKISAENMERFHIMEDSLMVTVDSMYNAFIPESRLDYSNRFIKQLLRTLKLPNSYYYPFDKLKTKINIMYPDDNAFRIFNWEIVPSQINRRYYAAIQMPAEQLKLFPLIDCTSELGKDAQDSSLTNTRWYGAYYYRILTRDAGGRKVYTMLGLNASNPLSNKKIIDPMEITEKGVVFGLPIFDFSGGKMPVNSNICRYILEYKKDAEVSMNWDDDKKMIYFDHLVSQVNDPYRKYTFVPSGEMDGFKWDNDKWVFQSNILPVQILKDGEAPSGDQPLK